MQHGWLHILYIKYVRYVKNLTLHMGTIKKFEFAVQICKKRMYIRKICIVLIHICTYPEICIDMCHCLLIFSEFDDNFLLKYDRKKPG